MYAVVDIETTGGSSKTGRITEIAIYQHDGQKITGEFSSLVNPDTRIPPFISNLTGISNEMVQDAPRFYEIAKKIVEFTEGRIFVGHNVLFDYSFVKKEFQSLGYDYKLRTLCTVRLSRKLIPGMPSYSLGKLCKELNIPLENAHRASADALATTKLMEMLMVEDKKKHDNQYTDPYASLVKSNRLLSHDMIYDLPQKTGVYFFYNKDGNLIYVGKSNNIRNRVLSHFRNNTTRKAQEMKQTVTDIKFELTGSELVALLMESEIIKQRRPKFNSAQRRTTMGVGILSDYDWNGYITFRVDKIGEHHQPLASFPSKQAARNFLDELIERHQLCQKLSGIYATDGSCFHHSIKKCNGACVGAEAADSYNERAVMAMSEFKHEHSSFVVIDKGRKEKESSIVMVENGKYLGYGFTSKVTVSNSKPENLREHINTCLNTRVANQIIRNFVASDNKLDVIPI